MSAPRPAGRLLVATFELYRRYPWLFLVLAAAVIVPYELIALAATGSGVFSRGGIGVAAQLTLTATSWFFVTPLVSALHVHAVADVMHDREPRIGAVALQGLKVLPVVAAAAIISALGMSLGFLALIVPGIILWLRWAVVAQAAAIEHEGWLPALRRSADLTDGHYMHVFVFLVVVGVIAAAPVVLGGFFFEDDATSAVSFLVGLVVTVITASFTALASALLYYDLVARWGTAVVPESSSAPRTTWDPRAYSDEDRPKGWYVNPDHPSRMSHWGGPDSPEWNGTTKTPRKIARAWREEDRG
jgi:hypothetical protein